MDPSDPNIPVNNIAFQSSNNNNPTLPTMSTITTATTQQTMPTTMMANEMAVIRKAGRQAIRAFLESHNCFAVMRISGKVVVFDTRIPIQLAFYALVEHDMLVAPLWDPFKCQFVGLLTVTDFIEILRYYKATGKDVSALAITSIADILMELGSSGTTTLEQEGESTDRNPKQRANCSFVSLQRPFQGVDSDCTLKQACQQLLKYGQDFLPIVFAADMRVLACITYTNILEHLVTHFREQRRLFDDGIIDLGIGTYGEKLITVTPQQTLAEALELMSVHGLSALPVVDHERKLKGVYARADITFLTRATDAEDAVRNLDLPIAEILSQARQDVTTPDALRVATPDATLQAIFESFAQLRFNRLYVVDAEERLIGAVSARDLVAYFLSDADQDEKERATGQ